MAIPLPTCSRCGATLALSDSTCSRCNLFRYSSQSPQDWDMAEAMAEAPVPPEEPRGKNKDHSLFTKDQKRSIQLALEAIQNEKKGEEKKSIPAEDEYVTTRTVTEEQVMYRRRDICIQLIQFFEEEMRLLPDPSCRDLLRTLAAGERFYADSVRGAYYPSQLLPVVKASFGFHHFDDLRTPSRRAKEQEELEPMCLKHSWF
jgi:hypothetical protein